VSRTSTTETVPAIAQPKKQGGREMSETIPEEEDGGKPEDSDEEEKE
jgi:hypothetical protein